MQVAREKGIYLTEALGEKLGETITIEEPAEWQPPVYTNNNNYGYYDAIRIRGASSAFKNGAFENPAYNNGNAPAIEVDFRKIKLKYEVSVVFALK